MRWNAELLRKACRVRADGATPLPFRRLFGWAPVG
jgi:hypothetical protein